MYFIFFFFFKQKTAYEMRISDWSSDVCSSDLHASMFEPGIALPLRGESLAVTPLGPISRAVLRCREADIDPVSERPGIILPRAACRSAHDQALSQLLPGPAEWVMMSTELDDGRANGLSALLAVLPCSLIHVSHRQVGTYVPHPTV